MTGSKRILGLVLVALLTVALAACGGAQTADDQDTPETTETGGPEIQSDDFESGDTGEWSESFPAESAAEPDDAPSATEEGEEEEKTGTSGA